MSSTKCEFEGHNTVTIRDRLGNVYDLTRQGPGKFSRLRHILYSCGVTETKAALGENKYATPPAEFDCATCKAKLICRKRGDTNII